MSDTVTTAPATWLLPAEAYTSPEWLGREERDLFGRMWVFVASLEQLANPGDYVSTTVGAEPVMVVRGQDHELRAFVNLCPHRGITLVSGCGNAGRALVCPYHHWNFALSGELRSIPQAEQFPGIDRREFGLRPLALAVWGASVFVNLAPDPEPFEQWLGGFPATLGLHDHSRLVEVAHRERVVQANWKFLVENTIEVYHLWYLHRTTQDQYENALFRHEFTDRHFSSYTPLLPGRRFNEEESNLAWDRVPEAPWLGERERSGIYVQVIFPNVCIFATSRAFRIMTLIPETPGTTRIDLRTRVAPGVDPAIFEGEVNNTFEEDVEACERMQIGVRSAHFGVAALARDHERPIGTFQAKLLAAMEAG